VKNKAIDNMTNAHYHAQTDYFSSTFFKEAEKNSLQHAKEGKVELGWETQAVGDAFHASVLEPEKDLVVCGPETRRGKAWTELQEEVAADGKILLTEKLYDQVKFMAQSLLSHPECRPLLTCPSRVCERSIFISDPTTNVKMRCRGDVYSEKLLELGDVKSCISAHPRQWSKQAWSLMFPIQAAFYYHCHEVMGYKVMNFSFLCCEKTYPYISHKFDVSNDVMEWGLEKVREILSRIVTAQETDDWSHGWGDSTVLELPNWLKEVQDERL
tara:strand:- start:4369 stop:5178 length:810 start_codon:yes stop_codon:yes gene_type:complete